MRNRMETHEKNYRRNLFNISIISLHQMKLNRGKIVKFSCMDIISWEKELEISQMFLVVSEEILLSQTELRFAKSATVEFSFYFLFCVIRIQLAELTKRQRPVPLWMTHICLCKRKCLFPTCVLCFSLPCQNINMKVLHYTFCSCKMSFRNWRRAEPQKRSLYNPSVVLLISNEI